MKTLAAIFLAPVAALAGDLATLTRNGESYDFDTAAMSGSLRADGPYHGVTRLVDKRTGRQVIDPRYSALNLFRLFSVNLGMGTPRSMERKVNATETAVEITWPASEARQGEITARYEVREPDTIDLTVTLRVRGTYAGYELLLPSCFDKAMIPHVYLKRRAASTKPTETDLVVPMFSGAFRGCGLVFPRDAHAARRPLDGRWERNEYKMPTAPFLPMRHYAHPVAFMTDPEKQLAVVLMMRRESCSAISARSFSERDEELELRLARNPSSASPPDRVSICGHDCTPPSLRPRPRARGRRGRGMVARRAAGERSAGRDAHARNRRGGGGACLFQWRRASMAGGSAGGPVAGRIRRGAERARAPLRAGGAGAAAVSAARSARAFRDAAAGGQSERVPPAARSSARDARFSAGIRGSLGDGFPARARA
jgi:hypothetical protein